MTDQSDLVLPQAEYDALLAGYPWIRSRDRFAYVGRGWKPLLTEMLDAMDAVMRRVVIEHPAAYLANWYTKEKFAGLRVHFALRGAPPDVWDLLRVPIRRAEDLSIRTCEACGAQGRLLNRGGWYATRCDAHA